MAEAIRVLSGGAAPLSARGALWPAVFDRIHPGIEQG
jgi:hypothetical protein